MNIINKKEKGKIEIVIRDKIQNYSKTITIKTNKSVEIIKKQIEKVLE